MAAYRCRKRRPRLHDPENEVFSFNQKKHAFEELVPIVDFNSEAAEEYLFQVRYSDVDINQHLTTTRYVDWMFDTFSPNSLRNKQICGLTLNFLKELTFGQKPDAKTISFRRFYSLPIVHGRK